MKQRATSSPGKEKLVYTKNLVSDAVKEASDIHKISAQSMLLKTLPRFSIATPCG